MKEEAADMKLRAGSEVERPKGGLGREPGPAVFVAVAVPEGERADRTAHRIDIEERA